WTSIIASYRCRASALGESLASHGREYLAAATSPVSRFRRRARGIAALTSALPLGVPLPGVEEAPPRDRYVLALVPKERLGIRELPQNRRRLRLIRAKRSPGSVQQRIDIRP